MQSSKPSARLVADAIEQLGDEVTWWLDRRGLGLARRCGLGHLALELRLHGVELIELHLDLRLGLRLRLWG
jgi:hypothetical protein